MFARSIPLSPIGLAVSFLRKQIVIIYPLARTAVRTRRRSHCVPEAAGHDRRLSRG